MLTNLEQQYLFPIIGKTLHKMSDYDTIEIDNNEKILFFEIKNKSYDNLENIINKMKTIENNFLKNIKNEKKNYFSYYFREIYYKLLSKIVLINEIEYKITKININLSKDYRFNIYFISDSNVNEKFQPNLFWFDCDKILISSFIDGFIGAIYLSNNKTNWNVFLRYFNDSELFTEDYQNDLLDTENNTILDIKFDEDILTIIFIENNLYSKNIRNYSKSDVLKSYSDNIVEMCCFNLFLSTKNTIEIKNIKNSERTLESTLEEYFDNHYELNVIEEEYNNEYYYSLLIFKENDIKNELCHSLIIKDDNMCELNLTFKKDNYDEDDKEELENICSIITQKLDLNKCNIIDNVENILLYHDKIEINKKESTNYYDIYYFLKSNNYIESIFLFKMEDNKSHHIIKNIENNSIIFCPNEINKKQNKIYFVNLNYMTINCFEIDYERKLNVLDLYVSKIQNIIVMYCSYYGFLTDLIVFCKDEKGVKKMFREIKRKENNLLLSTDFEKIEFTSDKRFKICYKDVKESFSIEKNNRRNILVKN